MKIFKFAATVCIAFFLSTATVAASCDDDEKLQTLALNIYYEARGEPEEGMRMIGEVTLNRVSSSHYPNTICGVVYQKSQFSWVKRKNKTPSEHDAWEKSLEIAEELLTDGKSSYPHLATHFANLNKVNPSWAKKFDKVITIGDHTFFRM